MVATKNTNEILNSVLINAIDFLNKSADEFENNTKYSIINFFCAIELFLKARLIAEHWSLIVGKKPNLSNFKDGTSSTLQFDELIYVLKNAFDEPQIHEDDIKAFDEIRKERNRLIHFYHDINKCKKEDLKEIKTKLAIQILKAWYRLRSLLSFWDNIYKDNDRVINSIIRFEAKIVQLKNYYNIRYEAIKNDIQKDKSKNNVEYRTCNNCKKESLRITNSHIKDIFYANCVVCGQVFKERMIEIECPNCNKISKLNVYDLKYSCDINLNCGHKINFNDFLACVKQKYNDNSRNILDILDFSDKQEDIINCAYCGTRNSVAYINGVFTCTNCGAGSVSVRSCSWCNELQLGGDLRNSYLEGCEFCQGRGYEDNV